MKQYIDRAFGEERLWFRQEESSLISDSLLESIFCKRYIEIHGKSLNVINLRKGRRKVSQHEWIDLESFQKFKNANDLKLYHKTDYRYQNRVILIPQTKSFIKESDDGLAMWRECKLTRIDKINEDITRLWLINFVTLHGVHFVRFGQHSIWQMREGNGDHLVTPNCWWGHELMKRKLIDVLVPQITSISWST